MDWVCNYRFAHQGESIIIVGGARYCVACAPEGAEPDPGTAPIPYPWPEEAAD